MKKLFYFIVLMTIMTSCIFNTQDKPPVSDNPERELVYDTMLELLEMDTDKSYLMANILSYVIVNDIMDTESELEEVVSAFTHMLLDELTMEAAKEVEESDNTDFPDFPMYIDPDTPVESDGSLPVDI